MRQLGGKDMIRPPVPWAACCFARQRSLPERPFSEASPAVFGQSPIYTGFRQRKTSPVSSTFRPKKMGKIAMNVCKDGTLAFLPGKSAHERREFSQLFEDGQPPEARAVSLLR